ncbi:hypothetical protein QJQ45_016620 [Haematococcus lacustris]|nr:hypothetical protein QJQ45_016620 [Haematococcus lacustris]
MMNVDDRAAVSAWKQHCVSTGLFADSELPLKANKPQAQAGVSLEWLVVFVESLAQLPGGRDMASEQIVQRCISHLTRVGANKTRLWNLIPPAFCGPPDYYLIHTWSDSLRAVVCQVVDHLRPRAEEREGGPPARHLQEILVGAAAPSQASTYVWLDLVALMQHMTSQLAQNGPDLGEVRASLLGSRLGSLVVMGSQLTPLTRVWYECWATVYYGSCQRLQVVLPDDVTLELLSSFQDRCRCMDITRAAAAQPQDKLRIIAEVNTGVRSGAHALTPLALTPLALTPLALTPLALTPLALTPLALRSQIKHTVGLNRMHRLLPESLMRSARAGLRWGGSLCRISMYCAILLKNNEQAQAQALLHAIPEIHDDERTLQDIRDVFKVYDTDGSGELDRDEFVEVLGVAGFTSDEAHSIFGKVDTDGGGSVSLVEFEKWWIESQRQQSTRYQHGVELTLDALLVNLKAMIALLERQQLHSHVAFYQSMIARLQAGHSRSKAPLLTTPVKGEWQSVAEQCAWRVSAKDYQGAAKLMYDLLMWNADALDHDPALLPLPSEVQGSIPQLELLCSLFEQFGRLLARCPETVRQSEYFIRAAAELREGVLLDLQEDAGLSAGKKKNRRGSGMSRNKSDSAADYVKRKARSRSRNGLFPGRFDMQREAIVGDMVRLKYGPTTLLSSKLIVEAEKSLGQWMAAQKSKIVSACSQDDHGNKGTRDDREAVKDFTRQYLADVKRGVRFLTAETPPDVGVRHSGHQGSSCASGPVIEMVVPVSSRCQHVTPRLLHSLFFLDCSSSARKVTVAATAAGCLSSFVLAIADSDGSVTFSRLHWGLHPPQGGIQAMSAPGPEVEGDNLGDSDAD